VRQAVDVRDKMAAVVRNATRHSSIRRIWPTPPTPSTATVRPPNSAVATSGSGPGKLIGVTMPATLGGNGNDDDAQGGGVGSGNDQDADSDNNDD
jgi:hypothetical protein